MGRRRKKKRTNQDDGPNAGIAPKPPKTFIMERGRVGRLLNELIMDLRHVMEPYTASQLKATRRNTLKDFVHVAGPLGVSHFILVSKSDDYVNLKMVKLPRGPTLTFHIEKFSLARDIISSSSKPPPVNKSMFFAPPTLVLNNFSSSDKPTQLMATMLQNMYPALSIQTVKLASLKRCVLWNYKKDTNSVEFRHYGIKVVPRGTSRGIRKIAQSKIPNLGKYEDISEFVLGGGASESEAEEAEGEVTLAQDVPGRGNIKQQQSAVKLYELGPRMSLQLVKIEEGVCTGEVLHHEYIEKTTKEAKLLRKKFEEQRQLKAARKREQEKNVQRKKEAKEAQRLRERVRQGKIPLEDEGAEEGDDSESDEDAEWYRKEVGVNPDPDLMLDTKTRQTGNRKKRKLSHSSTTKSSPSKRRKFASVYDKKLSGKRKITDKTKSTPLTKKVFSTGTVFRRKLRRN